MKWSGFAAAAVGVAVFPFAIWYPGPWGTIALLLVMFGCVFVMAGTFLGRLKEARIATTAVTDLHEAVRWGDVATLQRLLATESALANARSETDPRGAYPLHVAAESGQAEAARMLLEHGADVSLRDGENDAIALGWAAFLGRPAIVSLLLQAGSDHSQRNRHGLTPLACAEGGVRGQWDKFSSATRADWQECASIIRSHGGLE